MASMNFQDRAQQTELQTLHAGSINLHFFATAIRETIDLTNASILISKIKSLLETGSTGMDPRLTQCLVHFEISPGKSQSASFAIHVDRDCRRRDAIKLNAFLYFYGSIRLE